MKRIHYDETDLRHCVDGFLAAALWTLPEDDDGNVAGDELSISDFTHDARTVASDRCNSFLLEAQGIINQFIDSWTGYTPTYSGGTARGHKFEEIGHDLWLTMNGHGSGFWDGDYPAPYGQQLTELAEYEEWYVQVFGDSAEFL